MKRKLEPNSKPMKRKRTTPTWRRYDLFIEIPPTWIEETDEDLGLEDMRAEEKALEYCQENHGVGCTEC